MKNEAFWKTNAKAKKISGIGENIQMAARNVKWVLMMVTMMITMMTMTMIENIRKDDATVSGRD